MDDGGLLLSGGSRGTSTERRIPFGDLSAVHVARESRERLGGRPTVVTDLRDGSVLAIAGVATVGAVHELSERLRAAVATVHEND